MTVSESGVICADSHDDDFTVGAYRELVRLAIASYDPAGYRDIPWGSRFVLWRHDCDFSLNRALALAKIESEEGLRSTFFVNPHSEFYNLLERTQLDLINRISELGHDLALHFDAAFYDTSSEEDLEQQVLQEAELLSQFLGVYPAAFSFHNPTDFLLTCEAETYGGLVNCYSHRFKADVPYCSDSNGYWRFRRLSDVISEAKDPCLQVLTHPGWWRDTPQPPRRRIFQSVYGRANAAMSLYDQRLSAAGRENLAGQMQSIKFLEEVDGSRHAFLDYLWNTERFEALFLELWRLLEGQCWFLCRNLWRNNWGISEDDVSNFLTQHRFLAAGKDVFRYVFDLSVQDAVKLGDVPFSCWHELRVSLIHGECKSSGANLEEGCIFVCHAIEALADWGRRNVCGFDGLSAAVGSIGQLDKDFCNDGVSASRHLRDSEGASGKARWERLKSALLRTETEWSRSPGGELVNPIF